MRIGLNGRFGTAPRTGVQRFASEVSRRLVEREEVTLLLPRNGWVTGPARWKAAQVIEGRLSGHWWEQLELTRQARRAGCDVTLHLANTGPSWGGPNVLMVHDVTPITSPEWYTASFRAWYRFAMARAARRAARVLTGSEWARAQVADALHIPVERISVVRQGVAPFDAPAPPEDVQDVLGRFGLSRGYVLAVGGRNPRKNVAFLEQVMAGWRSRHQGIPELVVVGEGAKGIHSGVGRRHGERRTENEQRLLGHVTDSELRALYTGASVFCFPSLAEGFGRPPLEAMGCGTPVIAADYGAAREVLGDAAQRLPLDVEAWVEALDRLTTDQEEPSRWVGRGSARAAEFSWDEAAEAVRKVCGEVVGGARGPARAQSGAKAPARLMVRSEERPAHRSPRTAHGDGVRGVAVVHDWLTGMRGGEKVLEALIDLYPVCEIFTLIHVPGDVSPKIEARPIHRSFLSRLPGVKWYYRYLLPLFPGAIERFDLSGFDLVISVSHCVAKGVRPPPGALHVCYCLTPMRYVWDQYEAYFGKGRASLPVRLAMRLLRPWLRRWDVRSAGTVDRFVAVSRHVSRRIARAYGRDAEVVYPPVEVGRFREAGRGKREAGSVGAVTASPFPLPASRFYLTVSALVPYKRVDLLVDAFNELGRPLVVVGEGSEYRRLRRRAGPHITFTERLPDDEVADLMRRCRAFVYAAEEDLGMVFVEALAAGAPVIAYERGGAGEVVALANGRGDLYAAPRAVLYARQSVEALVEAVRRFETGEYDGPGAPRDGNLAVFERQVFAWRMQGVGRGL